MNRRRTDGRTNERMNLVSYVQAELAAAVDFKYCTSTRRSPPERTRACVVRGAVGLSFRKHFPIVKRRRAACESGEYCRPLDNCAVRLPLTYSQPTDSYI